MLDTLAARDSIAPIAEYDQPQNQRIITDITDSKQLK